MDNKPLTLIPGGGRNVSLVFIGGTTLNMNLVKSIYCKDFNQREVINRSLFDRIFKTGEVRHWTDYKVVISFIDKDDLTWTYNNIRDRDNCYNHVIKEVKEQLGVRNHSV